MVIVPVIDSEIIECAKQSQVADEWRLKKEQGWVYLLDRLSEDDFGRFYVDFLGEISATQGITQQDYITGVIKLAESKVTEFRSNPDIYEKWVFLEKYAKKCLRNIKGE